MKIKYSSKYTSRNIIIIVSILTFAYIYCLIYAPSIENKSENKSENNFETKLAKMHTSCLNNCDTNTCKNHIEKTRGEKYFISMPESKQSYMKSCIVTFWSVAHLLMYAVLTYLVPSFYIEFFFIGVAFEIYEYYKFKCHDVNDIIFNTLGIFLGKYLSPYKK